MNYGNLQISMYFNQFLSVQPAVLLAYIKEALKPLDNINFSFQHLRHLSHQGKS